MQHRLANRLGRNRPRMNANSAHPVTAVDQRNPLPMLRSIEHAFLPRRAGSDNDKVVESLRHKSRPTHNLSVLGKLGLTPGGTSPHLAAALVLEKSAGCTGKASKTITAPDPGRRSQVLSASQATGLVSGRPRRRIHIR